MGKLFSPPKMPSLPALPAIVEVPAATITAPVTTTTTNDPPAGSGGASQDATPEVTPDEQRVQNILTRNRGRVGTIGTSFSGVLTATNNAAIPARKTLLGE